MEFNITFIMLLSNGTYMPISLVITQVDMVSQQGDCPSVTLTLYELELDN